jgi:hypothetical protein
VLVASLDLSFRDPDAATARYDALLNDLRNNPGVAGFATSWNIPTSYDENFNTFYDPATNRSVSMRQAVIDDGLLPIYRIPMTEGRNFDSHIDKRIGNSGSTADTTCIPSSGSRTTITTAT